MNLKKKRNKKISKKNEVLFFKYLSKLGYFIKSKSSLNKAMLVKSFQRHFRQKIINGKIDQECLIIAKNLSKSD